MTAMSGDSKLGETLRAHKQPSPDLQWDGTAATQAAQACLK